MARLRELCGTRSPNPLASAVPAGRAAPGGVGRERTAARAAERMAHPSPAQAEFAAEFLRRRLDGGLSQSQLGAALGYDGSYVSKVERGKTWPSREFARRVDEVLATGEAFQDRHGRHTHRHRCRVRRSAGEPRDGRPPATPSSTTRRGRARPGRQSRGAACAAAHAAVQAAVGHAQAEEAGAGARSRRPRRAGPRGAARPLARRRPERPPRPTARPTPTAVGVVGMTAPCQPAPPLRPTTDLAASTASAPERRARPLVWSTVMTTGYLLAVHHRRGRGCGAGVAPPGLAGRRRPGAARAVARQPAGRAPPAVARSPSSSCWPSGWAGTGSPGPRRR